MYVSVQEFGRVPDGRIAGAILPCTRSDRSAWRDEILLAAAFCALLAVVIAAGMTGRGGIGRAVYIAAALGIAYVAKRRSPWLFVSATLWFWLFSAFVRRILEWKTGFIQADFALIAPNIMVLLTVPDILTSRGLLIKRGVGYGLLLFGCGLYALAVSFFQGEIVAGAIGAADQVVPLLYLFYFVSQAERIDEAADHLQALVTISTLIVVPYGIYQFFGMPEWDAFWMLASKMGSTGQPLPESSRVFSTLNAPAMYAIWCGTCIVFISHFRNKLLLLLLPGLMTGLAMAMTRAAYGSTLLAILLGATLGRGSGKGFRRLIALSIVAGVISFFAVESYSPVLFDRLANRFDSVQNLSNDNSAHDRAFLWRKMPALLDAYPFGTGLSTRGHGNGEALGLAVSADVDSGPISIYLSFGWIGGTLYLGALIMLLFHALAVTRRNASPLALTMASAAFVPFATLPFNNVAQFPGAIGWICLGYVLALDLHGSVAPSAGTATKWLRSRKPVPRLT